MGRSGWAALTRSFSFLVSHLEAVRWWLDLEQQGSGRPRALSRGFASKHDGLRTVGLLLWWLQLSQSSLAFQENRKEEAALPLMNSLQKAQRVISAGLSAETVTKAHLVSKGKTSTYLLIKVSKSNQKKNMSDGR